MKKTKTPEPKEDYKTLYLRVAADFENYKRRTEADKKNWTDSAKIDLLSSLLPLLDNLTLMASHKPEQLQNDPWAQGVEIVANQIESTLTDQGIIKINPEIGESFDPQIHEAIATEKSEFPEESIVKIQKPGYKIGDNIIRAAQVITSSGQK